MLFSIALENALFEHENPIITEYDVYRIGTVLLSEKQWKGQALKRVPATWERRNYLQAIGRLVEKGELVSERDFTSGVWRFVHQDKAVTAEQIACAVDPFCYISHLSALQHYGLSSNPGGGVYLTTPARAQWRALREAQATREFAGDRDTPHPTFNRIGFPTELRRRPIFPFETRHMGVFVVAGDHVRVSALGRAFIESIAEPKLCGSMTHVLKIWQSHARSNLETILAAIQSQEEKILKVRAGYILSECLGIEDPRIEAWKAFAQRGGSRKLDPEAPYVSEFSQPWMLSINI